MLTALLVASTLTVHVPAAMKDLSRQEVVRIMAEAGVELNLVEYSTDLVSRGAGEVVLIFGDDAPRALRGRDRQVMGFADPDRRLVYVFVHETERGLRLAKGEPLFYLAVGRIVAHELEHVRRGGPGHDERGWFRSCPSRDEMVELGWGPRKAEGRR